MYIGKWCHNYRNRKHSQNCVLPNVIILRRKRKEVINLIHRFVRRKCWPMCMWHINACTLWTWDKGELISDLFEFCLSEIAPLTSEFMGHGCKGVSQRWWGISLLWCSPSYLLNKSLPLSHVEPHILKPTAQTWNEVAWEFFTCPFLMMIGHESWVMSHDLNLLNRLLNTTLIWDSRMTLENSGSI